MAIRGYNESSLATSEVYKGICQSSEHDPNQRAINLIKNAKHLTNEDIETAYISVRQISDTLTREAVKAFDTGRLVLIYNSVPSQSLTQVLPFITYRVKNDYVTYIFVDKWVTANRDGVLTVSGPALRDLLTGALISNGLKRNYSQLASSQYMAKVLTEIYTKFVTRVINRQYSIMADKVVFDTIQYWIARFFLTNIFGSNDTAENIDRIASSHFKYIDDMAYEDLKRRYEEASPTKFSELLDLVKTASPRMNGMNMGRFLSEWINYYYYPAMLAVDTIEYLIFMCITLLSGNNIINIAASSVVKETKNIKSFRGELLKLI